MDLRLLYLALAILGCAWGLTTPLLRIAVSTGHPPLGLLLWQQVFMVAILGLVMLVGRVRLPDPRPHLDLFVAVALLGSVLPGYFAFLTAAELPAGVRAIILAIVPMFALPIALIAGFERPKAGRLVGVLLGAVAIALIVQPGAGLPAGVGLGLVLLALISPLSYGCEANYLAWRGSRGLHPLQMMIGASVAGAILSLPLVVATGQSVDLLRPWGAPEWALLAAAVLNAGAYTGYVWLVGQAGSVFASQVAYIVTATGVLWSKALLGETYSAAVWTAFVLMIVGLALVQPRPSAVNKGP
jgi:drug/metabolite transporter (DMT)-like permease